jgi:methylmalonyl-CoA epimerase
MKVEKIDHVAILVKDLEKAGKFFADLLDTEFAGPNEIKELDIRNLMSPEGIELVTPLTPDGPTARTLAQRGEGVTLISLEVPNVVEATGEMKAKGVRQVGGIGTRVALFHPKDLYGVLVELIER